LLVARRPGRSGSVRFGRTVGRWCRPGSSLPAAADVRLDVLDFKTDVPPRGPVHETYPAYVAQVSAYARLLRATGVADSRRVRSGLHRRRPPPLGGPGLRAYSPSAVATPAGAGLARIADPGAAAGDTVRHAHWYTVTLSSGRGWRKYRISSPSGAIPDRHGRCRGVRGTIRVSPWCCTSRG